MAQAFILGPREHHPGVKDEATYRRLHEANIARKRALGSRVEVHRVDAALDARIENGWWVVDCECGAGNATSPEIPIACCFACGAVHETIVFPPTEALETLERLLLARPNAASRWWKPGETFNEVFAENRSLKRSERR